MEKLPEPIRTAVDHLSDVSGTVVESSPWFIPQEASWAVGLRITTAHPSAFVPEETRWVVLLSCEYPAGSIRIYPNKNGGLANTFPHQDRNVLAIESHTTWRTGKPCLDDAFQRLGRVSEASEPKFDPEQRLRWHVKRCIEWLSLAGSTQLMVPAEPFEVPQCTNDLTSPRPNVVHDEGRDTWSNWKGRLREYGEIHWTELPGFDKTIIAETFFDAQGQVIRRCRRRSQSSSKSWVGFWWLWPSPVVIRPWHTPGTWEELREIGDRLEMDVDQFLGWMAQRLRRKDSAIVMIGYPIPEMWGGAPGEVHWRAMITPEIPKKGYRPNALSRSKAMQRQLFGGERKLCYLKTSNWHPDRLQARGRFTSELRSKKIALIGAGALGSAIAELLARGGISEMLIIDHDNLESGNLVRHTLTGAELARNKATATAERLQRVAPMSSISDYAGPLPIGNRLYEILEPFDIVLDCTGEDDVLRCLDKAWWSIPRTFLSVSLGFGANRLFLYKVDGCSFPFEEFEVEVEPWLAKERVQWTKEGETLEGAGCWSPLFPARYDDLWLAAVTIVKYLESDMAEKCSDGLSVFERRFDEGMAGYRVIESAGQKAGIDCPDEGCAQ